MAKFDAPVTSAMSATPRRKCRSLFCVRTSTSLESWRKSSHSSVYMAF